MAYLLGIIGLWTMTASALPDACGYANSNLQYIKGHIKKAFEAQELNLSRYNAYKALNGIEKTRGNLEDCGCKGSLDHMEKALAQLKAATRKESLGESKALLGDALRNTLIAIEFLRDFNWENSGPQGRELLESGPSKKSEDWLYRTPEAKIREQVEESLAEFENSIQKVIDQVECREAHRFLSKIHEESRRTLLNTELSKYKKQYHLRVDSLVMDALGRLGPCPDR